MRRSEMKRIATVVAEIAVFGATLALPAVADGPETFEVETEQLGINPCTGDPVLLTMVAEFTEHSHQNSYLEKARLIISTGDIETTMANLRVVQNQNGTKAWIREMHNAPDGSKFKVTIINTIRNGQEPEFSFDVRCVQGPDS